MSEVTERNENQKSTELTVSQKSNVNHLASVGTLNEQLEYATVLVKSKILPKSYTTPEAVMVALERSRALGCSVVEVIYGMDFIQNKPTLSVRLMTSLVQSKGGLVRTIEDMVPLYTGPVYAQDENGEWFEKHSAEENKEKQIEATDWRTTLRGYRPYFGKLVSEDTSFLYSEAEAAGLTEKDNWRNWLRDMLYARCFSRLCKRFFADMTTGMYSTLEMKEVTDIEIYEDDLATDPVVG